MGALLLALVVVIGGAIYFMISEPAYRPVHVEKPVPNAKLGR